MKIKICDMCALENKGFVKATCTTGIVGNKRSYSIDVCEPHRKEIPRDVEEFKKLCEKIFPDLVMLV